MPLLSEKMKSIIASSRRRFLPRDLWARAMLIMVMPVVLLQAVGAIVFYDNHWQSVSRRLALSIAADIRGAISLHDTFFDEDDRKAIEKVIRSEIGLNINFLPPQENIPGSTSVKTSIRTAELVPALQALGMPFVIQNMPDEKMLRVLFFSTENTIEVFLPYKRFFSSTTYIFALWVFFSSLLLLTIAVLFLRNQIRPILRLAAAAKDFGLGRDVVNFKPEGATEVRQAAISFLQMRDRIRRHIDDRTRMLAGVSHDLRTPLTRMRLQLTMMDKKDESIQELLEDVSEMEHMVNGYLDFARGEGKENTEPTDMNKLITDTLTSLRREGISLQFISNTHLTMNVRRNDFKRCLWNLVSNASRYANIINVTMNVSEDKYLEIIVEDNGPGIPKEKRDDVFKAFFRIDESRNSQTGGIGLGLTITRDIVLTHGGKIYMEDSTLGGLKVVLIFPI